MAEPQPPTVQPDSSAAKAASKDDAKAAAALDSLDARGEDADAPHKPGDTAALAGAMKDLKVDGTSDTTAKAPPQKVKIDAKDVALIVEQCEMSKSKATELLRGSEGDLVVALGRFVEGKA